MRISKKKSPLVFEGEMAERYKATKNRWIRLAIISTLLPLLFASFVGFYNGAFDILTMFGSGEIVMSLFSLTIPLLFDLFEIKKENDENLSWAFFCCAIIICVQILLYCLIRIDNSTYRQIKSIVSSVIMLIASWLCCRYSIKVLFLYSTLEGGNKNA